VLDAGLETLAVHHGKPALPADVPESALFLSDEHATLAAQAGWRLPGAGACGCDRPTSTCR
jgi:hypothetical protein